jgi:lipopolysaccharide heptosyltransferase II
MSTPPLKHIPSPFRRILIIKPGAVGDLLQMTPVIRALKRRYPDAAITMLVGSASSASLFRHHPAVSDVILFERAGTHRTVAAQFAFLRDLRRRRFDLVLNFQRSNIRSWLFIAAAVPARVLVYHKARKRAVHAVVNYLETIAPLGIPAGDPDLELVPGAEAEAFAAEVFARHGLPDTAVVALNPGASHAVNRWPVEYFAVLADLIAERLPARVLLIGGPDDKAAAEEIITRSRSKPLSLAGTTSLLQLGAVLARCAAVVSGDTGPMHMATAVGAPVVALFGAADPARTGPVGTGHRVIQAADVSCVPCRSRTCSSKVYLDCMRKITPEMVLREVSALLTSRS